MKALIGLAFAAALVLPAVASEHSAAIPVSELTHIHGVVLPPNSDVVLLATHHGLFAVNSAGSARMASEEADDFMKCRRTVVEAIRRCTGAGRLPCPVRQPRRPAGAL